LPESHGFDADASEGRIVNLVLSAFEGDSKEATNLDFIIDD
jgi:hypothetical protein